MFSVFDIIIFASLGLAAGTLSGLFGIGGGMVIVPGLYYLFQLMDLPSDLLMHLAAGSSMCIMMFTSASSAWFHHLKGDVQWGIFRTIIPSIGCGVLSGIVLANHLESVWLEGVFGTFLVLVSIKILSDWSMALEENPKPNFWLTSAVGTAIGFKSGVLGIGGGALSVPFLLYCGLPMHKASGTSASFTLPIAILGTLILLFFSHASSDVALATGYIYWPAVYLVAPFTMLGAPLGTHLSHIIPTQRLKTAFAIFLLFLGLRMLGGSFHFV